MSFVALPLPIIEADSQQRQGDNAGPRSISAVQMLRISVTDRCNFRCVYCMPEDAVGWTERASLLSFEEIVDVARVAYALGVRGFKLTGGEPLVRHELPAMVEMLSRIGPDIDLSMTTNGALLPQFAAELKRAGLHRITVSLDTLSPERFKQITRGARVEDVFAGIESAVAAGFRFPKINCVAMRGINDDEFADFARYAVEHKATVRFIEYMPLGRTALGGEYEARFVPEAEIQQAIEADVGPLRPVEKKSSGTGPAREFRIGSTEGRVGFISAMSKPFCETCNRLRLTAEGQLRSCLFDGGEVELRPVLRAQPDSAARRAVMEKMFVDCVAFKPEVHSYYGNRQMSQIGG